MWVLRLVQITFLRPNRKLQILKEETVRVHCNRDGQNGVWTEIGGFIGTSHRPEQPTQNIKWTSQELVVTPLPLLPQVSVSVSPKTVDAGGDVAITVTTKPNAFVGVLAVDQRSLILGNENHLTQVRAGADEGEAVRMACARWQGVPPRKGKGNWAF